jgi:hypothetical protein
MAAGYERERTGFGTDAGRMRDGGSGSDDFRK